MKKIKLLFAIGLVLVCAIGHTIINKTSDIAVEPALAVATVNGGNEERVAQITYREHRPLLRAVFPVISLVGLTVIFGSDVKRMLTTPVNTEKK